MYGENGTRKPIQLVRRPILVRIRSRHEQISRHVATAKHFRQPPISCVGRHFAHRFGDRAVHRQMRTFAGRLQSHTDRCTRYGGHDTGSQQSLKIEHEIKSTLP